MCAAFLVPFGQILGEAGAGVAEGRGIQEDMLTKHIQNQLLQQKMAQGKAEFETWQKQQAALPGALQSLFGDKGKELWALGDPGIKMAVQQYMDRQETESQRAYLLGQAKNARAAGDETAAKQYENMAGAIAARFPTTAAGQMSGVMTDPLKSISEALGTMEKQGVVQKQQQEATDRQHEAALANYYGADPSATGAPAAGTSFGPITDDQRKAVTDRLDAALAKQGIPPDARKAMIANILGLDSAPSRTGSFVPSGESPPPTRAWPGPTPGPTSSGGGPTSTPTPTAAAPVSGLTPTPTPTAAAPVSGPTPKHGIHDVPRTEVEGLLTHKGLAGFARAELARRDKMMPNPRERLFLDQMVASAKVGDNLEKAVRNLGPVDKATMTTMAHLYQQFGGSTLLSGVMSQKWQDYFTAVGAAYWALFNSGSASGSKQGVGLLNKVSDHFPTANQKFWPDMPQIALGKIRQLLTDPDESAMIAERNAILKKQWEAENGAASPFVTPDEENVISRHRSY